MGEGVWKFIALTEALSHGYAALQEALNRKDWVGESQYLSQALREEREDNKILREDLKNEQRRNHLYETLLQNEGYFISGDEIQKMSFDEDDEDYEEEEGTEIEEESDEV